MPASPKPVPLPISLVVKNGSNTWSMVSAAMPLPVSAMPSITYCPAGTSPKRAT